MKHANVTNKIVIPVTVSLLCFLLTFFRQLVGYKGRVKAYIIRNKSKAVKTIQAKSN